MTADGDLNDLTLSEIKGKVTQNGEILGDVHMENVAGPIHLHTSVTDLQVAELPGDLTLNSDDLRVNEAKGQVRVTTHSKDVDLSQIYGDSYVEDRDGRISVEPAGNFGVEREEQQGRRRSDAAAQRLGHGERAARAMATSFRTFHCLD